MFKLNTLKVNPSNPRILKDYRYKKLLEKIKKYPNFLEFRPIVYDDLNENIILGGTQRYRCLKELGYKEVSDSWVKPASTLNEDEKRAFIIIDNVSDGEWDYDILANEWDAPELEEWGVELDYTENDKDKINRIALKSYEKFHILLSCDINYADKLLEQLSDVMANENIEYEKSAN